MFGWQEKSPRWRFGLIFAVNVCTAMLVVLSGIRQWQTAPEATSPSIEADVPQQLQPPPPPTHTRETRSPETLSQDPGEARLNILLIGQDSHSSQERARSDAMLLCSYHRQRKDLTVISFLRDLYVPIPGHGKNRLNAAYAWGGAPLLKQTFSDHYKIRLDGCVEVDFDRFAQLVDLLGGVPLDLRSDEANRLDPSWDAGLHILDGAQALAYARIRDLDPDGDFSRTQRQRKLLEAMLERFRQRPVWEYPRLLEEAFSLITTDLSAAQLTACALQLLPQLSGLDAQYLQIPAEGTYAPETIDGMAVLVADPQKTNAILQEALAES